MEKLIYVLYLSYVAGYYAVRATMTPMQRQRAYTLIYLGAITVVLAFFTAVVPKGPVTALWWLALYWVCIVTLIAYERGWVTRVKQAITDHPSSLLVATIAGCAYLYHTLQARGL
jgi:hypothetical protein